ncbi:hypothetical protein BX265_6131 [Streptomyces sp. TLI_235]|nr:hypothetical protein [Streptomyces sp. TLI_235]PBC71521.1 hypothetical protein BX265_6131 [Streptomyces sp. TLI_235]
MNADLKHRAEMVVQAVLGTDPTPAGIVAAFNHAGLLTAGRTAQGEPTAPQFVWRAEHDTIPLGTYLAKDTARTHCEDLMRRAEPDAVLLHWVPDFGGDCAPEELCYSDASLCSGFYIVPVPLLAAYDPGADE